MDPNPHACMILRSKFEFISKPQFGKPNITFTNRRLLLQLQLFHVATWLMNELGVPVIIVGIWAELAIIQWTLSLVYCPMYWSFYEIKMTLCKDMWSVRFSSSDFRRKTGRSSNCSFYTFWTRTPSLFCLLTVRFTQLPILEALQSFPKKNYRSLQTYWI